MAAMPHGDAIPPEAVPLVDEACVSPDCASSRRLGCAPWKVVAALTAVATAGAAVYAVANARTGERVLVPPVAISGSSMVGLAGERAPALRAGEAVAPEVQEVATARQALVVSTSGAARGKSESAKTTTTTPDPFSPDRPRTWQPEHFLQWTTFCWQIVRAGSYEVDLVREQFRRKANIFACTKYALLGEDPELILGPGAPEAIRMESTQQEGITPWGYSANVGVFIAAWRALGQDGRYKDCDWVIKVDPDAVFMPPKMRLLGQLEYWMRVGSKYLPPWTPDMWAGTWVPNCDRHWSTTPSWDGKFPMMYGSLEVVSSDGMARLVDALDWCMGFIDMHTMSEDEWMGRCFRAMQMREVYVEQEDGYCIGGDVKTATVPNCANPYAASFHPLKDVGAWSACYETALATR